MNRTVLIATIVIIVIVAVALYGLSTRGGLQQVVNKSYGVNQNAGFKIYRNNNLKISFSFPAQWTVDESLASKGFVSVQSSSTLDLNAIEANGKLDISAVGENPEQSSPQAWVEKTLSDNLNEIESRTAGKVGSYESYAIVVRELHNRKHIYLFSATRVVEVAYPVDQPQFQSTYDHIVNSVRIE